MIPKPRKVRRVRRLCMHARFTLAPVSMWDQAMLQRLEADPAMQAWGARVQEAKAAECDAFQARKQARRSHVDPR